MFSITRCCGPMGRVYCAGAPRSIFRGRQLGRPLWLSLGQARRSALRQLAMDFGTTFRPHRYY